MRSAPPLAVAVSYTLYLVHSDSTYRITVIWLSSFAVIQIALNVVSIISAGLCMADFQHGIVDIIKRSEDPASKRPQPRMVIE